jgi:hypothetical protein
MRNRYEALVLVAQEVCAELEAGCIGKGSGGGGGAADLSRIAAALTLVHAIAARSRLLQVFANARAGRVLVVGCLPGLDD